MEITDAQIDMEVEKQLSQFSIPINNIEKSIFKMGITLGIIMQMKHEHEQTRKEIGIPTVTSETCP